MRSLAQLFQKEPEEKKIDEKTVLYIVKNIIIREYGNKGWENIQPISFREGKLILRVSGSIWESEVLLQKGFLKKEINKECAQKIIQEIFIKK